MRLGGPQSKSGSFGEETNLLPLLRFEPRTALLVATHYTCYVLTKCNFVLISLTVIMHKIKCL